MELNELTMQIVKFRDARDWKQFHAPNHLAAAISIEAAELQEHFLWMSAEQSRKDVGDPAKRAAVAEEIADVLILTLLLAHEAGVDAATAIASKLKKNADKYPVEKARGKSAKYTEL
jgi:dCTP diphosphatase